MKYFKSAMEINSDIEINKIVEWGLATKVKKEIIIDLNIKDIAEPNENEKYEIRKKWLTEMNLNTRSALMA